MDTGQPSTRPGWHQDPWGPPGAVRYWDGGQWTPHVRSPAPAPDADGGRGAGRARRLPAIGIGGVALAVVIGITLFLVLGRGQGVGEINTPVLGVKFAPAEVQKSQPEIEARLGQLEKQAQDEASVSTAPVTVDLTGDWTGSVADYAITQYGADVVVEERTSYGTTGVGVGTFDGSTLSIVYEAVDGSTGTGDFVLVDDDTLQGSFDNDVHGTSGAVVLTR